MFLQTTSAFLKGNTCLVWTEKGFRHPERSSSAPCGQSSWPRLERLPSRWLVALHYFVKALQRSANETLLSLQLQLFIYTPLLQRPYRLVRITSSLAISPGPPTPDARAWAFIFIALVYTNCGRVVCCASSRQIPWCLLVSSRTGPSPPPAPPPSSSAASPPGADPAHRIKTDLSRQNVFFFLKTANSHAGDLQFAARRK